MSLGRPSYEAGRQVDAGGLDWSYHAVPFTPPLDAGRVRSLQVLSLSAQFLLVVQTSLATSGKFIACAVF